MFGLFGGAPDDATAGAQIVWLFTLVITLAIIGRALLSWFQLDPSSPIAQVLNSITDPILEPFRRIVPRLGMLDISPMVAIIVIQIASRAIQDLLIEQGI